MTTTTAAPQRTQTTARATRIRQPARPLVDPSQIEGEDANGSMYVYLDSGQIAVVRNVSGLEMSDKTLRLIRDGRTVAEYSRRDIFCASRERIAPPCFG